MLYTEPTEEQPARRLNRRALGGEEVNSKYLCSVWLFVFVLAITSCARNPVAFRETAAEKSQLATSVIMKESAAPTLTPTVTPTRNPCFDGIKSPNEKYIARIKYDNRNIFIEGIEICDISGTIIWTIPSELEKPTGDPHPNIDIYGWSKDSLLLYFRYYYLPDGGDFAFFWDGFDLQSINIVTGNIQKLLPIKGFISFSFSPDGTKITYLPEKESPHYIHIREVSTGIEKKIMIDPTIKEIDLLGNIFWYSDGEKLAFQAQTADYWIFTFYLNLDTMQLIKVNDYHIYSLMLEGWTNDGRLKFYNYDKNEVVVIDPIAGTTIIVTPTLSSSTLN